MPSNAFNPAAAPANDNIVPSPNMKFLKAAEFGDVDKMRIFLNDGADINARQTNNDTALIIAAREGHLPAVLFLLRHKADVTAQNNFGQTAFLVAAINLTQKPKKDDERIARALLRAKSPVNAKENDGATAMHYLTIGNRGSILTETIKAGADLKITTKGGITPMMMASYLGDSQDAIAAMMPHDFGINMQDDEKMTALMHAVRIGDEDLAESFVGKGANILLQNDKGQTARKIAQEEGLERTEKFLAEKERQIYAPLGAGLSFEVNAPEKAAFKKKPKPFTTQP